jgi:hypothetical protein
MNIEQSIVTRDVNASSFFSYFGFEIERDFSGASHEQSSGKPYLAQLVHGSDYTDLCGCLVQPCPCLKHKM